MDPSPLGDKLNITVDLTFHALTCAGTRTDRVLTFVYPDHRCQTIDGGGLSLSLSIHPSSSSHVHTYPCMTDVHVDAMDVAGDNQMKVEHNMLKQRLSPKGTPIG